MTFVTGTVVAIYRDEGVRFGKVRVSGALVCVPLELVPDARVGDDVLVHAGTAIAQLDEGKEAVPCA